MRWCEKKNAQDKKVDQGKPVEVTSKLWVLVSNDPIEAKGYDKIQREKAGKAVNENVKRLITGIVIIKESQDADMSTMQVVYYQSPRPNSCCQLVFVLFSPTIEQ